MDDGPARADVRARAELSMPERASNGLPSRRDVEAALRALGLSHRQARKFVAAGWPALVGETQAELDEMRALLEEVTGTLRARER